MTKSILKRPTTIFLTLALLFLAALLLPKTALAVDIDAADVTGTDGVYTLSGDTSIKPGELPATLKTIDTNGYTLTIANSVKLKNGDLTITGTGNLLHQAAPLSKENDSIIYPLYTAPQTITKST